MATATDHRLLRLEARIRAVNAAHAEAERIQDSYRPILEEMVGRKVTRQDHSPVSSLLKRLPELPNKRSGTDTLFAYWSSSDCSLRLTIKASSSYPAANGMCDLAMYHEATLYLGQICTHVLNDLALWSPFKHDWKAEDVIEARAKLKEAEDRVKSINKSLHPFNETER